MKRPPPSLTVIGGIAQLAAGAALVGKRGHLRFGHRRTVGGHHDPGDGRVDVEHQARRRRLVAAGEIERLHAGGPLGADRQELDGAQRQAGHREGAFGIAAHLGQRLGRPTAERRAHRRAGRRLAVARDHPADDAAAARHHDLDVLARCFAVDGEERRAAGRVLPVARAKADGSGGHRGDAPAPVGVGHRRGARVDERLAAGGALAGHGGAGDGMAVAVDDAAAHGAARVHRHYERLDRPRPSVADEEREARRVAGRGHDHRVRPGADAAQARHAAHAGGRLHRQRLADLDGGAGDRALREHVERQHLDGGRPLHAQDDRLGALGERHHRRARDALVDRGADRERARRQAGEDEAAVGLGADAARRHRGQDHQRAADRLLIGVDHLPFEAQAAEGIGVVGVHDRRRQRSDGEPRRERRTDGSRRLRRALLAAAAADADRRACDHDGERRERHFGPRAHHATSRPGASSGDAGSAQAPSLQARPSGTMVRRAASQS